MVLVFFTIFIISIYKIIQLKDNSKLPKTETEIVTIFSNFNKKPKLEFQSFFKSKIYVKIWIDNKEYDGMIYKKGEDIKYYFTDNLKIKVSDAGAAEFFINKNKMSFGKTNEIANKIIKIIRENSKYKVVMQDW